MKKYRGVFLKNENEIAVMREANQLGCRILDELEKAVAPGVKTMFFEEIARECCREMKVRPAFLGYMGYPFALCCSVNEEVVHGFPSERILKEGDIVSFDMGVVFEGFYSDSARTVAVGEISPEARRLLDVTRASLEAGIAAVKPGKFLKDVSAAVQQVAESAGFSVVRRFVGHGIGRNMHEKPEIPNFVAPGLPELVLQPGMVLAIEPMVSAGTYEVDILADGWTAVTRDKSLAAHYEHSVAVTHDGHEILSLPPEAAIA